MSYLVHIFILVNLYVILGVSLNLLAGFGGLLSLCAAGFFGVGAYTTAVLTLDHGWSWLGATAVALAGTALASVFIGSVAIRFRDDYFAIATFALQVILTTWMVNWVEITRGPMGLPGIPQPEILGWRVDTRLEFAAVSLFLAAAAVALQWRLVRSPFGRLLRSIREDEVLTQALGRNPARTKISAFTISALGAGLVGTIYAPYIGYIDPGAFTIYESIFILTIVIFGGSGSLAGPIFGALVLVSLPEALRFLGVPSPIASSLRQVLYGLALVGTMIWRPQGIIGRFGFQQRARR